jgi:hypothetical protein
MLLIGKNEFVIAPLFQPKRLGRDQTILNVVKRTYTINDAAGLLEVIPKEDQPKISGPGRYGDDLGRSLMYPGDVDNYKPAVDVVINGCAYAPGGEPVTELDVSIEIDGRRKNLRVFGNRRWEKNEVGEVNISDTEPFTEMPIRWEKAFGYLNNRRNPLGMGKEQDHETDPENPVYSLPNVENPEELLTQFGQDVRPVGFSAIAESWEPRQALFGTRSAYWANFIAPLPPKNQDLRFHNAAPEDQQFEGLIGDEIIRLTNMHERILELDIILPGIKPRIFYVPKMETEEEQTIELIEIPLKFDTVVIDLNEKTLTLIWRGHLDSTDKNMGEKYYYMYAVEDSLSPQIPMEEIQSKFEEDVKSVEDIRANGAEITPEFLLSNLLSPVLAQIGKTLAETKADPALVAQIATITDPEKGIALLKKEFFERSNALEKDLKQSLADIKAYNSGNDGTR